MTLYKCVVVATIIIAYSHIIMSGYVGYIGIRGQLSPLG